MLHATTQAAMASYVVLVPDLVTIDIPSSDTVGFPTNQTTLQIHRCTHLNDGIIANANTFHVPWLWVKDDSLLVSAGRFTLIECPELVEGQCT